VRKLFRKRPACALESGIRGNANPAGSAATASSGAFCYRRKWKSPSAGSELVPIPKLATNRPRQTAALIAKILQNRPGNRHQQVLVCNRSVAAHLATFGKPSVRQVQSEKQIRKKARGSVDQRVLTVIYCQVFISRSVGKAEAACVEELE